jgi:predicted nucleotidyltransferase
MSIKENIHQQLQEKIPYLKMLILFGSRARGDIHSKSDWDFAALYDQEMREKHCQKSAFTWFEVSDILADIFNLDSDNIDVVDLDNCSVTLADSIANEGQLIYQKQQGLFKKFKQKYFLTQKEKIKIRQLFNQEIDEFLKTSGRFLC